jgi:hypothetical protein
LLNEYMDEARPIFLAAGSLSCCFQRCEITAALLQLPVLTLAQDAAGSAVFTVVACAYDCAACHNRLVLVRNILTARLSLQAHLPFVIGGVFKIDQRLSMRNPA